GDLLDRDLLEQVPGGSGLDRLVQVRLLVGDRQHQDLDVRQEVADLAGRLDAGALGHPDIHQDHVRHELLGLLDGLDAVRGLADELEVVLLIQDHLQAATEQRVVVGDHDAQLVGPLDLVGLVLALRAHAPSGLRAVGASRARSGDSVAPGRAARSDFSRLAPASSFARRFVLWSRSWRSSFSAIASRAESTSDPSALARKVRRGVSNAASTRRTPPRRGFFSEISSSSSRVTLGSRRSRRDSLRRAAFRTWSVMRVPRALSTRSMRAPSPRASSELGPSAKAGPAPG